VQVFFIPKLGDGHSRQPMEAKLNFGLHSFTVIPINCNLCHQVNCKHICCLEKCNCSSSKQSFLCSLKVHHTFNNDFWSNYKKPKIIMPFTQQINKTKCGLPSFAEINCFPTWKELYCLHVLTQHSVLATMSVEWCPLCAKLALSSAQRNWQIMHVYVCIWHQCL
jgi:hypothetical protein